MKTLGAVVAVLAMVCIPSSALAASLDAWAGLGYGSMNANGQQITGASGTTQLGMRVGGVTIGLAADWVEGFTDNISFAGLRDPVERPNTELVGYGGLLGLRLGSEKTRLSLFGGPLSYEVRMRGEDVEGRQYTFTTQRKTGWLAGLRGERRLLSDWTLGLMGTYRWAGPFHSVTAEIRESGSIRAETRGVNIDVSGWSIAVAVSFAL